MKKTPDLRVLGLIFLVVFFLFAGADFYWQQQRAHFSENGIETTARVLEKYRNRSGFHIKYMYPSKDGVEYKGDEPFAQQQWEAIDAGSTVSILYLKNDPSFSISPYRLNNLGLSQEWKWLFLLLPLVLSAACYAHYRYVKKPPIPKS